MRERDIYSYYYRTNIYHTVYEYRGYGRSGEKDHRYREHTETTKYTATCRARTWGMYRGHGVLKRSRGMHGGHGVCMEVMGYVWRSWGMYGGHGACVEVTGYE